MNSTGSHGTEHEVGVSAAEQNGREITYGGTGYTELYERAAASTVGRPQRAHSRCSVRFGCRLHMGQQGTAHCNAEVVIDSSAI